MHSDENRQKLLDGLREIAARLRQFEQQAAVSLNDNDQAAYRLRQAEKTEMLIDLPRLAAGFLTGLDADSQETVTGGLNEFVQEAIMAKKVDSIFYMSVLLCPEKESEAGNNAFDNFIDSLERGLG